MANQEHLAILAKGVAAWHAWREKNLGTVPDLRGADLHGARLGAADLNGANLKGANLSEADLFGATLRQSRLREANLRGAYMACAILDLADLFHANLTDADLHAGVLSSADLGEADLTRADLRCTGLSHVNLSRAILANAQFGSAVMGRTLFLDVDLSGAIGLDEVTHLGPSTIAIDTIYRSQGKIPDSFLRGAGVPDNFIAYMKSLTGAAFDFYSCFISHSTKDQDFAERLYAGLQAKGVRCWFAPHDIQGGRKVHEQIDEAIRLYDKLLLVLSEHSMNSEWVKTEIAHARQKELNEKRQVLFPISLVPFAKIQDWKCFDADTGKDSAREIREYFIPDFSNWKDHDSYSKAISRLLRDLNAGQAAGTNLGP